MIQTFSDLKMHPNLRKFNLSHLKLTNSLTQKNQNQKKILPLLTFSFQEKRQKKTYSPQKPNKDSDQNQLMLRFQIISEKTQISKAETQASL